MKKILFLFSLFFSFGLYANGFEDCGSYNFKGVLKENSKAALKMHYVVNEGTTSQMTFEFSDKDDLLKLIPLLNKPSSFNGKILKKMDGTRGVVTEILEIALRYPNPLVPFDTGITRISALKCD